jgi:hypothetical protein
MQTAIELDDFNTWPPGAVSRLQAAYPMLLEYKEAVRAHLNAGGGSSNYPTCEGREGLKRELDRASSGCEVVGYHCTRLTAHEMADVRRNGIVPLSRDLLANRVSAAVAHGELSPDIARRLVQRNYVDDTSCGRRLNMLWLVFSKDTLTDESGLRCLMGYWGGEAVYVPQSDETRDVLRQIGCACIVEAIVPVSWLKYKPIGDRLLNHYEWIESGRSEDYEVGFESPVTQAVPGTRVRRVIAENDRDFEALTHRSSWEPVRGRM